MLCFQGAHLIVIFAMSTLPKFATAQSFSCADVAGRTNLRTVNVPASTAGLDSTGLIFCYQLDSSHSEVRSAVSDATGGLGCENFYVGPSPYHTPGANRFCYMDTGSNK